MRQMITRVEDDLHVRVKEAAAARGMSVNAFVVETLAAAVGTETPREAVRRRAEATGRRVVPPPPDESPSWADVIDAGAGAGDAVSRALAEERQQR
jgi:plasmid stability protein